MGLGGCKWKEGRENSAVGATIAGSGESRQIITALKKAGNVGRKAIGYLKGEKRLYEHRKGDSMIGLANTMAANIIQPVRRNSLNASDAQLIEQVVRGSTEGLEEAKNKVEEKTSS
eukprot:1387183-Amorphochlora_amoeboformis.AAC.2